MLNARQFKNNFLATTQQLIAIYQQKIIPFQWNLVHNSTCHTWSSMTNY